MKRKFLAAVTLGIMLSVSGCSTPATTPPDNSAEIESLKAQVESLQAENDELKKALEETESIVETESEDTAGVPSESVLALNEEGSLDDWGIIVTNAEISERIKENDFAGFNPEEGNKYLAIEIAVTNNGKNASTFLPNFGMADSISAKILYQNDYEFSATQLLGYSKDLHNTSVNPLSTKSGVVAFEIPDSVASSEEELILVISAGNKNLHIKVR